MAKSPECLQIPLLVKVLWVIGMFAIGWMVADIILFQARENGCSISRKQGRTESLQELYSQGL